MRDVEQGSTENFAKNDGAEQGAMSQASSAYEVGQKPEMPSGSDSSMGALPPGRADDTGISFGPPEGAGGGSGIGNDGASGGMQFSDSAQNMNESQEEEIGPDDRTITSTHGLDGSTSTNVYDNDGFRTNSEIREKDGRTINSTYGRDGSRQTDVHDQHGDRIHSEDRTADGRTINSTYGKDGSRQTNVYNQQGDRIQSEDRTADGRTINSTYGEDGSRSTNVFDRKGILTHSEKADGKGGSVNSTHHQDGRIETNSFDDRGNLIRPDAQKDDGLAKEYRKRTDLLRDQVGNGQRVPAAAPN